MRFRMLLGTLASMLVAVALTFLLPGSAMAEVTGEPDLSEAECAIVEDSAGNVLWAKNEYTHMSMASITKVMTAMVALDSGMDLDTTCTIYETDLGADSQTAGYTTSDTPTLRELLRVMLVYSANDAAENIAINVAGSEEAFVELMNQKAAELGMDNTHFSNPHGLEEDDHYSCAADLALMGRTALSEYPFIAATVHLESVTATIDGTETTLYSTDDLIGSYQGVRGIKTGAVGSGTAFLGACQKDGVELFTCVLGCDTSDGRFEDTAALLDWAYDNYDELLVARRSMIVDVRPWAYNFAFTCVVRPSEDEYVVVWPDGGDLNYTSTFVKSSILLDKGELAGTTTWSQDGREAGSVHYTTTLRLDTVPSINIFALPLFGYY
ncbi:MAG: D-alanyl-D-alanine carboxypeptidase family protein [Tractidigestivibacter sp.]|jgi:D-alanyl-D-alanine carboxypeptidase (penicillin-binding protein 5/6)|uniref:D-alanyl-D-alanine carboxypeptidase family protein n=1 Tax=Tractidigestivibacter sp. TaxID=2847320 RepID=UPI003D8F791E